MLCIVSQNKVKTNQNTSLQWHLNQKSKYFIPFKPETDNEKKLRLLRKLFKGIHP